MMSKKSVEVILVDIVINIYEGLNYIFIDCQVCKMKEINSKIRKPQLDTTLEQRYIVRGLGLSKHRLEHEYIEPPSTERYAVVV